MQDTKRYQTELFSSFAALTDEDLIVLGTLAMKGPIRGLSLDLGSWLTRCCRAEFDGRHNHGCEVPDLLDVDSMTDGDLANCLQAALALSHSTTTATLDNFCKALVTWVSLFTIVRLQARSMAMSN